MTDTHPEHDWHVMRLEHEWFGKPLPDNVQIGAGSWLHSSYAFLHCRSEQAVAVRIGQASGVYRGTFFELGPRGVVTIGDFCTVVSVIFAVDSHVAIGNYCFLSHEVMIADSSVPAPWPPRDAHDPRSIGHLSAPPPWPPRDADQMRSMGTSASPPTGAGDLHGDVAPCIRLGDDVWIGAGAVLLRGARIGNGAIVGAGAVVDFEVPAGAVVAGNPARVVGAAAVTPS